MSENQSFDTRTRALLGDAGIERLRAARVAVFGIGGVGGYCAEALARAGIGELDLIDNDTVNVTNLNRQIIALRSTVGRLKTDVMAERIADINPDCRVRVYPCFFLPENADMFAFSAYSYIADCIDTVSAKIELVLRANAAGVPILCAMGAGNKIDPSGFLVADIAKTEADPLCRVMRRELRARGILHQKVLYSKELPRKVTVENDSAARHAPASLPYVPGVMGLIMAGEIIRYLGGLDSADKH